MIMIIDHRIGENTYDFLYFLTFFFIQKHVLQFALFLESSDHDARMDM